MAGRARPVAGPADQRGAPERAGHRYRHAEIVGFLSNRLRITDWRSQHPEVASGGIAAPIFIVGQPRTGTTILHDLTAQDPTLRAPLTWEVDRSCPPPTVPDDRKDPRIAEVQAATDLATQLTPGLLDFHPVGARRGQECVRITAGDFRSMTFAAQYRVPSYIGVRSEEDVLLAR